MSEELSPSGRYSLTVTTGGSWASRGVVTRVSDSKEIAVIERNYHAFPALWIEDHISPSGERHDYLLCGADYQSHTVIQLDTGKRRDTEMEGTDSGHGFCMAEAKYDASWRVVIVSGCIWACPYEFRVYDFADPMGACPELKTTPRAAFPDDDAWAEDDPHWPKIEGDLIHFYQSPRADDDSLDAYQEQEARAKMAPEAIKTFRRCPDYQGPTDPDYKWRFEGPSLLFVNEEVTPEEASKRRQHEEGRKRFEAKIALFKETDPLYLRYKELIDDPDLTPESYESHGVTHDRWYAGSDWKGDETRWCRRIMTAGRCIVELEWAIETGPIKVEVFLDHKEQAPRFFPHSTGGMREAFLYAKAQIAAAKKG